MVELADTRDLKSLERKLMRVRVPPWVPVKNTAFPSFAGRGYYSGTSTARKANGRFLEYHLTDTLNGCHVIGFWTNFMENQAADDAGQQKPLFPI